MRSSLEILIRSSEFQWGHIGLSVRHFRGPGLKYLKVRSYLCLEGQAQCWMLEEHRVDWRKRGLSLHLQNMLSQVWW